MSGPTPQPQQRTQEEIPNPTPSLPKVKRQAPGQGVKSVSIPSFREFTEARFDGQIKTLLTALGAESPYFQKAAKQSVKQGYTFKIYSPEDRSLSQAVHEDMKTGHYGAFTLHDEKKIVINLEALQRKGKQLARPESEQLLKCLANESMHIVCGSTFKMYNAQDVQAAFQAVGAMDSPWTQAELSYQKVFVEELASKVAETTIRRQLREPDFQFTSDDLEQGRHYFADMKEHYAAEVFSRMFEGASFDGGQQTESEKIVVARAKFFMENGSVAKRVELLLKEHKLMK